LSSPPSPGLALGKPHANAVLNFVCGAFRDAIAFNGRQQSSTHELFA
jgi:hypothetical protein